MRSRFRPSFQNVWWSLPLLAGISLLGCDSAQNSDEPTPPDYSKLVPVKGTVKIDGKPMPGVVVTFLPKQWSASNGETDANGNYSLETAGKPGALPGEYKVGISYMLSADGKPQGLAPRSAMNPPPSMATAREKIGPEFSDFGRTTLKATVEAAGGTFDFDVPANLENAEPAKKPADEAAEKPAEEAAKKPAEEAAKKP